LPIKDGVDAADGGWIFHHDPGAALSAWRSGNTPRLAAIPGSASCAFETTRGDRLFVSLLGSAFIHLAWLGLVGPNLWWALALSVVYAVGVFRYV
jgi:predicted small integral membrane protein